MFALNDFHRKLNIAENATETEIRAAYRALARKWHPDRFQEGPERAWAEKQMIEINQAYNSLLNRAKPVSPVAPGERFTEVRLLIEAGQLSRARQLMCAMDERSAEWNFHFGQMLLKRSDYEKASFYLHIAAKQAPDKEEYRLLAKKADSYKIKNRFSGLFKRLRGLKSPSVKRQEAADHSKTESH